VGCRAPLSIDPKAASPSDVHVRVVLGPPGEDGRAEVAVGFAGSSFGRGAHVHARPGCVQKACKGGLARALEAQVVTSAPELAAQITAAAVQRIQGLLLGARRAKLLAFGDEARECVGRGKAALVVLASDAGTGGLHGPIQAFMREGNAITFATKGELGKLFGRDEVAMVAILHKGIALQVHCARAAADALSVLVQDS
jgi:ribosomal protein L7Ae-like RNA K-turn-binding protein